MGRFRDSSDDDGGEAGIDMSPLIDCVFILLIFFIVTTVFVEETGVEVDRPQAASATQLEKTSILLAVTANGEVVYDDKDVGVAGVQRVVRQVLQSNAAQDEPIPVIIQGDVSARLELVTRVIDAAKLGGAQKISLATQKGAL